MRTLKSLLCVTAVVGLTLSVPVVAAIQLMPIVSGLSNPLFVGHAGDQSGRLFIVERGGAIKVLQPGASTPTMFLNITSKVQSTGSEQGLLGLAFHPLYETNGRFFVFYTRSGGEIVVAEYHVSGDPNFTDAATEEILLTIPHPSNTNHNGGMLAFGPDNYLYIGVGDGGGANDVPNNAQNRNVLLGKILRIDIDVPQGETYASPPSNPFVNDPNARDEIFVYGMRNPWRFSFDRAFGDLTVADVGQGAREEVNMQVASGGNYGWRIWEGFACTNNDPALCGSQAGYIFPVFDYEHTGGRCSITGGYAYRGAQGAVANGTYVYGDFCTGEIFGWTGGPSQPLLLDTALMISSFGEDESGELYVVGLGGTVSKIVSATTPPPPSCTYAISPTRANFSRTGGTGSVNVTVAAGCNWTATTGETWITVTGGASGGGPGTVSYSVAPYSGRQGTRNGRITIAGQVFTVKQSR